MKKGYEAGESRLVALIHLFDKSRHDRKWTYLVLFLCLAAAALLRISALANKTTIGHDESISYLSATCHQVSYSNGPVGYPVQAIEWKEYLQVDQRFCFRQISADLAATDIHPPFYFWLLHLWSLITDVHLWTGPSLNLIFTLLTTFFLFQLALLVLGNRWEAVLVVFMYAISAVIVTISLEARQYDLLALLTVLFIWQILIITDINKQVKPYQLPLLTLTTAAGALTHFHFVLPLSAGVVFAIVKLVRQNPRRLAYILSMVAVGIGLATLVFPLISVASETRSRLDVNSDIQELLIRLKSTIFALINIYHITIPLLIALIVLPIYAIFKGIDWLRYNLQKVGMPAFPILFFLCWIGGAIIVLYLSQNSPRHAMGGKYLSMAWPLYAFVPVLLLRLVSYRSSLLLFIILLPLILGIVFLLGNLTRLSEKHTDHFFETDLVVIDSAARGILPQVIWQLSDNQLVVVGYQKQLLDRADTWVPYLTHNSTYVSELSYRNSYSMREELLALIESAGFTAGAVEDFPIDAGKEGSAAVYRLHVR